MRAMMQKLRFREDKWTAMLAVLLIVLVIFAAMSLVSGVHPCAYKYKSYLLQAQAWLRGETALEKNYEYLELAVYEGRYYVSFPPVPALPMVIYTLIWGDDVPGGLFQKIYIAAACISVMLEIRRRRQIEWGECIAWAVFICLAGAMLPICLVGGVWYEAQILAFLFSIWAISAIGCGRPLAACICYALAVGCRPFAVLLGPVLLMMYVENNRRSGTGLKQGFIRLLPGLCAGLAIAAAYAAYNYARFGNIFEFGHNYLPEFTRAEHGQLSLNYIAQNWKTLLFGPVFRAEGNVVTINQFGFSMFASCPLLICGVVWFLQDICRRRMTAAKWIIVLMAMLNTLLLMMHRTLGGHQFGARYALELIPLCLCYFLLSPDRKNMTRWEAALLFFGLVFNFFGGCIVHI